MSPAALTPADWRLDRHPPTRDRSLRAHDAADVLALAELAPSALEDPVLVLNDAFGGLTVPLAAVTEPVEVWTDSVLADTAIERNLGANGMDDGRVGFGPAGSGHRFGLVIVKVPKTLAFLHQQLVAVREVVGPETRIIGAGMVRHIHTSTVDARVDHRTHGHLAGQKEGPVDPSGVRRRSAPGGAGADPISHR